MMIALSTALGVVHLNDVAADDECDGGDAGGGSDDDDSGDHRDDSGDGD